MCKYLFSNPRYTLGKKSKSKMFPILYNISHFSSIHYKEVIFMKKTILLPSGRFNGGREGQSLPDGVFC